MKIWFPKSEQNIYDEFLKVYYPYALTGTAESNRREFKQNKSKKCRFCQKEDVSFDQEPHLIPASLGSANFFSQSECDSCNALFGIYESHLSKYLGINRILSPHNTKRGFESANGNIVFRKKSHGYSIERRNTDKPDVKYNYAEKKITLDVSTQSYIPSLVYNALLKIALSVMPEGDINGYSVALKFLQDKNNSKLFPEIKHLKIVQTDFFHQNPFAILFKRNESTSTNFPLHTLCLYFDNHMFQIYFPLHEENRMKVQNDCQFIAAPYVSLEYEFEPDLSIKRSSDDLSPFELTNRKDTITLQLDQEAIEKLVAFDPKNGTFTPVSLKKEDEQ
jgi:hypothetical protein